ncbi:MAG: tetratricopeptide repeat-containing sensor histidine kinase [Chitinophagales bacterium]|nr:tetratricopeptide repeat-containing sensor histidine kinase [Chitinophagales bacterium]
MGFKMKFGFRFFLLINCIIILACCLYSCNNTQQKFSANLNNQAAIEEKYHVKNEDGIYLQNVIDSINKIEHKTTDTKVFIHYLNFIRSYYENKDYLMIFLSADTLSDYLVKNKLETVYYKYYTDALYAIGDYYFSIYKYDEALRYFYEARNFLGKLNLDKCSYIKFNIKMTDFYFSKGEYENVIPFAKSVVSLENECSSENSKIGSFHRIQAITNTIAFSYEKLKRYDSSIYYYRKGINYILSKKDDIPQKRKDISLGIYYGNLGGSFLYLNQYDSAIYYLNKSIEINDKPGYDLIDVQTAYLKLADLYLKINKPELARKILDKTKQFVTTPDYYSSKSSRSKWYSLNFDYYVKINDLKNAINAYSQFHHVEDSMNSIASKIYAFNVTKEIERIKEENKSKEIEKSNEIKTVYIIVFLISTILLTVITLLILRNNKQAKKRSRETIIHNLQLQTTLEQLQMSNKNYASVMKVMAHDLRSPFSGIIGITDLLLHDENITEKEKTEMLELMQTSANNSLTMIGELLQSSTSFEQKEIVKQPLDLIVLLKQCTDLLKFKAAEKQQTIHFYTTTQSVQVKADSEKLWRLFTNLIANAIKFSETKKSIYVYVEKFVSEVVVSVQDEGIGIPEKFKDKVFEMFTEAKRKGTAGEQPFGIGLSICKQIVEAHNGKIWFISNEPHGTTFYVALPLEQ